MPEIAYINGKFCPPQEATISIDDRGLLFGDAIYEVIKAYGDKPFLYKEHMERLKRGASELNFNADKVIEEIPSIIRQGLEHCNLETSLIYIQVSRGTQPRNAIYPEGIQPNFFLTFRPYTTDLDAIRSNGFKASIQPDIRWEGCNIKSTNLLANIMMKNRAKQAGYDEAVLEKKDGRITEGSSSSLFYVKDGKIITTPHSPEILPGVNRKFIVENVLPELDLEIETKDFTREDLLSADEAFLTASTFLIAPLVQIDSTVIADGKPAPVCRSIINKVDEHVKGFINSEASC